MHTPSAPGAQPWPCACHTACRRHLRTPSRLRSARPRWSRLHGHRILDVLVLAAAALEDQLDFDLVLFPLLEVDDGRLLAQVVAAVLAGDRIHRIGAQLAAARGLGHGLDESPCGCAIWLTPTGVCTKNVGMPVSWQMGPSSSTAISMFERMMSSACEDCVDGVSAAAASDMAARTSGGRLVEV